MGTSISACLLYLVCDNKEKIDSKDFFDSKVCTQSPSIYLSQKKSILCQQAFRDALELCKVW